MSEKKDRFDRRRYSRNHKWHGWSNAPSSYKRWEKTGKSAVHPEQDAPTNP